MAYDIPTRFFIKFDQGISEKSDGKNCAESGIIRIRLIIIIITRSDCVWMQTQRSSQTTPISEFRAPTNSSLQNTPRYQFSLTSETINYWSILLAAIFETVAS